MPPPPVVAQVGPNGGGVLALHANLALTYTTGAEYCGQTGLTHCTDLVTSVPASSEVATVFFVLAAFPLDSSPRLKGLSFGITYPPEDLLLVADGTCADFSMETTTWPASESGIAVTWNAARLSTITEVHWFAAYCYSPSNPATFAVCPHPSQGGAFADDAVPARIDPIEAYGTLGFGCDGVAACPGESPQVGTSRWYDPENPPSGVDSCRPGVLTVRFFPGVISTITAGTTHGFCTTYGVTEFQVHEPETDSLLTLLGLERLIAIAAPWRTEDLSEARDELGNPIDLVDFRDVYVAYFDSTLSAGTLMTALTEAPGVAFATCDSGAESFADPPNDPYYVTNEQWALHNPDPGPGNPPLIVNGYTCVPDIDANMPEAWLQQAAPGTKVAILDLTRFNTTHPELSGQFDETLSRYTGTDPNGTWTSSLPHHGGRVAGVVAAASNNSLGVAGTIIEDTSESLIGLTLKDGLEELTPGLTSGLAYLSSTLSGVARVANNSWGKHGCARAFGYNGLWRDSFRNAFLSGTILVAAGGNGADTGLCTSACTAAEECYAFPAAFEDYCLAVAGVQCDGQVMETGHTDGSFLDVAAGGNPIVVVDHPVTPQFTFSFGTSYAAPLVSAVISLLLAEKPGLTNEDCYELLKLTAENPSGLREQQVGRGLVRADRALALVASDVELVHEAETVFASPAELVATMDVELSNIAGLTPMNDAWFGHRVECYRLATSTTLAVPEGSHVLGVWGRGRTSTGWRRFDRYFENRYDGKFWANYAEVASWDGDRSVTLESFTYKVFSQDGTTFIGWFPFDPGSTSEYRVDYTYLWRQTDPVSAVGPNQGGHEVARVTLTPRVLRVGQPVSIEFSVPAGEQVKIELADVTGRCLSTALEPRWYEAGTHRVRWAAPSSGRRFPGGVYWLMLSNAGGVLASERLVVVR